MIAITAATVREVMLMHLVHLVESGQHEYLMSAGLSAATLNELRHLNSRDVLRISSMRVGIELTVDEQGLAAAIQTVKKQASSEKVFELFVERGASIPMLKKLFRVEPSQVHFARACLNTEVRPGRPEMPPALMRDAVHEAWKMTEPLQDQKDRFLALATKFPALRMDALFAVVNEFEADRPINAAH